MELNVSTEFAEEATHHQWHDSLRQLFLVVAFHFLLTQSICHLQAVPCLPPKEVRVDQKEKIDWKAHIENALQHSLSGFGPLLSGAEIALGDQFAAVHYLP